jgi:hypothetical protein
MDGHFLPKNVKEALKTLIKSLILTLYFDPFLSFNNEKKWFFGKKMVFWGMKDKYGDRHEWGMRSNVREDPN